MSGRLDCETEPVDSGSRVARVFSPSNIALAKYWGKRDAFLNLPSNSSVSITLRDFGSFTTAEANEAFTSDRLILNGIEEPRERLVKAIRVLEALRERSGLRVFARIQSKNNFPTAAGLASSASGLSALALAAAEAFGVKLELEELSAIARLGSGSACRSLFGGFVEWNRGERDDGKDSVGRELAPASHWPLKVTIGVVSSQEKEQASTGGMELTRKTSPYFASWTESAQLQARDIREAVLKKDFSRLAELAESNCLRMHASAMAAVPPVLYWRPQTVELIHGVGALRRRGYPVFFTIDAGPNVVLVHEAGAQGAVDALLGGLAGVGVLRTEIGEGARRL